MKKKANLKSTEDKVVQIPRTEEEESEYTHEIIGKDTDPEGQIIDFEIIQAELDKTLKAKKIKKQQS